MGKNNSGKKKVVSPAVQRANFLYQAAKIIQQNASNSSQQKWLASTLGRFYVDTGRQVCQKAQSRQHPMVHRLICKKCHRPFLFGCDQSPTGYRLNFKGKRSPHLVVTCSDCGHVKRFLHNPDYQLGVEKLENGAPTKPHANTN